MKIKVFRAGRMRQQQAFGFYQKVLEKVNPLSEKIEFLQPFVREFSLGVSELDEALARIRKSIFTEEVLQADERRDKAWRGLRLLSQLNVNHFNPEKVKTGKRAEIIIKTYGDPRALPYTEESAILHNIYHDFYAQFDPLILSSHGYRDWLDEMTVANEEFNKILQQREKDMGYRKGGQSDAARKRADEGFKNLVEKINAYITLNGTDAQLSAAVNSINKYIDEEQTIMKARTSRNANKKKDETDE